MIGSGTTVPGDVAGGVASKPARIGPPPARPKSNGWKCPFPPESDKAGVDMAVVVLQVTVSPAGHPESVTVRSDPGLGFGREATKCAMAQTYESARDGQNRPVRGDTPPIRIRFVR